MFIKQVRRIFIFRASLSPPALVVEPGFTGFTESHSRQIVIAAIMDRPDRRRGPGMQKGPSGAENYGDEDSNRRTRHWRRHARPQLYGEKAILVLLSPRTSHAVGNEDKNTLWLIALSSKSYDTGGVSNAESGVKVVAAAVSG